MESTLHNLPTTLYPLLPMPSNLHTVARSKSNHLLRGGGQGEASVFFFSWLAKIPCSSIQDSQYSPELSPHPLGTPNCTRPCFPLYFVLAHVAHLASPIPSFTGQAHPTSQKLCNAFLDTLRCTISPCGNLKVPIGSSSLVRAGM